MSQLADKAASSALVVYRGARAGFWGFLWLLRAMVVATLAAGLSVAAVIVAATWEFAQSLPDDPAQLQDGRERGSAVVMDVNGALLGVRGQRFQTISLEEAGPTIIDAILATEDRRFYWHVGVDPIGIARALIINHRAGRTQQGGSSITQQVVKLAYLTSDKDIWRKLREVPRALALETTYSKDEILQIYINRVYLGAGAFGVRAAAKLYFGVEPSEVSAAQAALIAGLLRAPSAWSPTNDFSASQERARVILEAMYDAEALEDEELLLALSEIDSMAPPVISERSSYFVDWAEQQVPDEVWERSSDVIVHTTLDPTAQTAAEQAIESIITEHGGRDADAQSATVVLSRDGAIRAMVGGRNYGESQFNRAADARRQMGSSFKPFVYAAALQAGVSPGGRVLDAPVRVGNWSPSNYAHKYRGWMPISTALARSSNVAAVRMSQRAGIPSVIALARQFGFADEIPAFPSLALGVIESNPLEVAGAYAVFNNDGLQTPPYGVTKITDRAGRVLWEHQEPEPVRVLSRSNATAMVSMLRQVVESGTGRRAQLEERPAAGKTGTTQDYGDAWFAGFTGDYVCVVWMGHDAARDRPMRRVTGGSMPAMIWKEIMAPVHDGMPVATMAEAAIAPSDESVGEGAPRPTRTRRVATPEPRIRVRRSAPVETPVRRRRGGSTWRTRWDD